LESFGAPLRLMDLPIPAPGPDEVLVRVGACGVCGTDLKISSGVLPGIELPRIMGHEISGTVAQVGDAVQGIAAGDRVTCYYYVSCGRCENCLAGRSTVCTDFLGRLGFERDGGFAEYVLVPARNCVPIPDALGFAEAGVLEDAVATPYHALVTRGGLRAGETVVLMGVGGLGLHALQVAKAAGSAVIAVDVSESHLRRATELGADVALPYRPESFGDDLRAAAGPGGIDLLMDTVGRTETLRQCAEAVRPGGRLVPVGYFPGVEFAFDTSHLVLREISVLPARAAGLREVAKAVDLVARGLVETQISARYPLDAVNEALAALRTGTLMGRAVIDFGLA
jgi:D-arabinose 1-dehydrogenase-like Zn-dependent alcohol dehydrogenase